MDQVLKTKKNEKFPRVQNCPNWVRVIFLIFFSLRNKFFFFNFSIHVVLTQMHHQQKFGLKKMKNKFFISFSTRNVQTLGQFCTAL
jgi:hypothetical protein